MKRPWHWIRSTGYEPVWSADSLVRVDMGSLRNTRTRLSTLLARFATVCLAVGFLFAHGSAAQAAETNAAIAKAMASVAEAIPRAAADKTRPAYHFHAPAQWMNDPNGPIYWKGQYHMFYQFNPYGDQWGNMHWGHARSADLVHWEDLPIALWPSKERGEEHCFSGSAVISPQGQPMIFYTSIGYGKGASDYAEQWVATGSDDLIQWQKYPANPVLSEKLFGEQKVYDWRDPFIFEHEGVYYLVSGGNLNHGKGGQAVVLLFQAEDKELVHWKYRGVLFTHPDPKVGNIECPNFFKIGDRWVLVISPHRRVEYFVGAFDPAAGTFKAEHQGLVDQSDNYYAPNCLQDPQGRRIMWGWVRGFKGGLGWNGCFTLPRALTLGANGELIQEPVDEVKTLRKAAQTAENVTLDNAAQKFPKFAGDTFEMTVSLLPKTAKHAGIRLRQSSDSKQSVNIGFDGQQLDVAGTKVSMHLPDQQPLKLRIFLDKSIMEVYVDGRSCITKVLNSSENDLGVELYAEGGSASFESIRHWSL